MNDWSDIPAQMTRLAQRLDRQRGSMFVLTAAIWMALLATSFSAGNQLSHRRATALAILIPLALSSMWVFFLCAWFGRLSSATSAGRRHAWNWVLATMLLIFGAVAITMSWVSARMFLRV
jgi:uncharacterized membrane protein